MGGRSSEVGFIHESGRGEFNGAYKMQQSEFRRETEIAVDLT